MIGVEQSDELNNKNTELKEMTTNIGKLEEKFRKRRKDKLTVTNFLPTAAGSLETNAAVGSNTTEENCRENKPRTVLHSRRLENVARIDKCLMTSSARHAFLMAESSLRILFLEIIDIVFVV